MMNKAVMRLNTTLENNIYYLTHKNKMKKSFLEESIGVKPGYLSQAFKTGRELGYVKVAAIAKIFHISVDDLIYTDLQNN